MSALIDQYGNPLVVRAAEGEFREGPYALPISGGWLPAGSPWNFWQLGRDVERGLGTSAMVEACVSAYAQTIAMCPGSHWVENADNGRDRQATRVSSLARVLRTPNSYQSISDFLVNATRRLYLTGNTFALAPRNDRFEINELHLMLGNCHAQVGETGEVFYNLSGNELIERRFDGPLIVPARDVLHIKLHTPRHPLIGETPLQAAMIDLAVTGVIGQQQLAFYRNQARPSFILSTDQILTVEQMKQLRARWDEQSQYLAAGGTPIMSAGLKPLPIYSNATDSQLAEVLKMSDQHIALAYRVPLQILGIGGTPFASTEALMQSWRASGLGFALNHVEEAFGQLFGLRGQPEEYVEFDTSVLLRSSYKERIEGAVAGVRGGLFAPNEARAEFSLSKQEYGDLVRVQQQDVPLSYGVNLQPPEPKPAASPPPAENPMPADEPRAQIAVNDESIRVFSYAALAQELSGDEYVIRFDESKHPRDDDGKWSSGGGGGGGSDLAGKLAQGASALFEEHAKPTTVAQVLSEQTQETRDKISATVARLEGLAPTDASTERGGHKNADGSWTGERDALHKQIVSSYFTTDKMAAATPASGEKPLLTMLGGRGGSGKGTLLSDGTIAPGAIHVDPDEIKKALPEYKGWNSAQVHEESSMLAGAVADQARKHGLNVVVDKTMATASAAKGHDEFKAAGYQTEGHYVFAAPETAARRALARFSRGGETGRYVPIEYVLGSTSNEKHFDSLKGKMDRWAVYDNNAEGGKPKRVSRGGDW